jgi:hypothetical protein
MWAARQWMKAWSFSVLGMKGFFTEVFESCQQSSADSEHRKRFAVVCSAHY